MGYIAKQSLQRLLRPQHAAGDETKALRQPVGQGIQFRPASFGQRKVRAAAVAMFFIGPGFSVANQIDAHFSRCSNPQKTRITWSACPARYWHSRPLALRH